MMALTTSLSASWILWTGRGIKFLFPFSQPRFHAFVKLCRVVSEKVELHGFGDAEQQVRIERGLAEHLVDMVAGAANLARQPTCAALVFAQLLVDELPDVDVAFLGFHCLGFCLGFGSVPLLAMKSVKISLPHVAVGSGMPVVS